MLQNESSSKMRTGEGTLDLGVRYHISFTKASWGVVVVGTSGSLHKLFLLFDGHLSFRYHFIYNLLQAILEFLN
jgi:hypothetical protein